MDKLLLIDDEVDVQYSFRRIFDSSSIELHTASSGEEGLKRVPKLKPDLVLMDIRMGTGMNGGAKLPAVGTKAQVWHGSAKHTSGGLVKKDLMKTRKGRIVSKRKHAAGKKALAQLKKAGYVAKKGTFKLFKKQK